MTVTANFISFNLTLLLNYYFELNDGHLLRYRYTQMSASCTVLFYLIMGIIFFTYLLVVQIYPIIAALFATNSAPAFAFFKFIQVGYIVHENAQGNTCIYFVSSCYFCHVISMHSMAICYGVVSDCLSVILVYCVKIAELISKQVSKQVRLLKPREL